MYPNPVNNNIKLKLIPIDLHKEVDLKSYRLGTVVKAEDINFVVTGFKENSDYYEILVSPINSFDTTYYLSDFKSPEIIGQVGVNYLLEFEDSDFKVVKV